MARRFRDEGVSEVLGTVVLTAIGVVIIGAFGAALFATLSETRTPPSGSFAITGAVGQRSVNVSFTDGSAFALSSADVILLVNASVATGALVIADPAAEGSFSPGDVMEISLADGAMTPGNDTRLTILVVDKESNHQIGSATRVLLTPSSAPPFLSNAPSVSSATTTAIVADGSDLATVTIDLSSSFGLALVKRVTLDLTPVGGVSQLALRDDGEGPDLVAGDGNYTGQFSVASYDFAFQPATETVELTATVTDIFGHAATTTIALGLSAPPPSKVLAGAGWSNIPSSAAIGYLNFTGFSFRDASRLENDEIELRVSDLVDATRAWTAVVTFTSNCGGGPGVTSIVLARDGIPGSVEYAPSSGCMTVDSDAHVDLIDPDRSRDASGNVVAWTTTGDGSTYEYENAGIGEANEARITYWGDAAGAQAPLGLGQADLVWGTRTTATPTAPGAPTGLLAAASDRAVSLSWMAPARDGGAAISSYNVYSGTTPGALTLLASIGTNTSFVVNSLTNGVAYTFAVAAVNAVGEGARSAEATATPSALPAAPQSVVATAANGSVSLSWTPGSAGGSPITSYRIYSGTTTSTTLLASTGSGSNTSFTVNGLTNGQTYFFNVAAVNANGEGPTSAQASATPGALPFPPSALAATAGNASVALSWTAPSDTGGSAIVSYRVYGGVAGGAASFVASTGASNTTFVVNSLNNGVAYSFAVAAVNAVGEGARSAEATATPSALPSAPQGLVASASNRSVSLSWTPAATGGSPITSYRIYAGTTTSTTLLASTGSGSNTSFTVNSLANGVTYFFNVAAVNANGEGAMSAQATATPRSVPFPPSGLAAAAGNASVALSWTAPSDTGGSAIVGYNVYRGLAGGATTFVASTGGSNTSFVVGSLTNGVTYFFNVTAVTAVGQSAGSNEVSATPAATAAVPTSPQDLIITPANARAVVAWAAPSSDGGSAITGYRIYRATTNSSAAMALLATTGSANRSFTDLSVDNNATYFYQVSAINAAGESARTSIRDATPRTIITLDCTSMVFAAGSGTCANMQLDDGILADLRESSGGTKILSVTSSMNVSGITGTVTLFVQADPNNAPERLLVQAFNAGTGSYDTLITVPSTAVDGQTLSAAVDTARYFSGGLFRLRLIDGDANTAQTGWDVDYIGLVVT